MPRSISSSGLDARRHAVEESLFHTANGYLGVRASFEEGPPSGPGGPAASIRGTYINGFYDTHPIRHPELLHGFPETGERIVSLPDAQTIELYADGERMALRVGEAEGFARELDMDRGLASREFAWRTASGKRFEIRITRLCSFERPSILAVEYRVACGQAASIRLVARLEGGVGNFHDPADPRVAGEAWKPLELLGARALPAREGPGGRACVAAGLRSRTRGTGFLLALRSELEGPPLSRGSSRAEASGAALELEREARAGEELVFVRRSAYADSIRCPEPEAAAAEALEAAGKLGFAALAAEQEACLGAFWEAAEARIEGDPAADEALQFSLFQLFQAAPRDGRASIPAKGLSGEGYEGHYFWDSEIYMLPFFAYTQPELARSMLLYRHATLDGARSHACEMGQARGAAFPWRTIAGRECSAYYPSGSAQYHIDADIAYAVWAYWEASLDLPFLAGAGAELLFETARTWLEIGHFGQGEFRIESVTGPDEYSCLVDNNFYTNAMAAFNLRAAARARELLAARAPAELARLEARIGLGPEEPGLWLRAAEAMYLPYDASRDITPQDDGFLRKARWDLDATPPGDFPLLLHYHHLAIIRRQVCKQADAVLAHLLLPESAAESTKRASFAYYEGITTHDSSLSYAAFSAMAARLGEPEKAYRYFSKALRLDLDDSHGNSRDGLHLANMGGSWLALALGFGGFRPEGDRITFDPVLPRAWDAISFRIRYRGSSIRLRSARRPGGGVATRLELASGPPVEVSVGGAAAKLEGVLEL
ncbi:MAG TPA: glycosyl hydrolase family 65 protein [Spirochaetia bacterium]|nr:glycosyl hydrolase family 65 protein [Spirochaetia bacterium]